MAAIFNFSLGTTLWTYYAEALIEKVIGVSSSANLVCTCIVAGVFPIAVEYLGISYTFFFFGVCMAIGFVYCSADLIETKGKIKTDIMDVMLLD